jgi:hypothetical protein
MPERLYRPPYLMERHDLRDGGYAKRIKTRGRSLLAIISIREINEDPAAAAGDRACAADLTHGGQCHDRETADTGHA